MPKALSGTPKGKICPQMLTLKRAPQFYKHQHHLGRYLVVAGTFMVPLVLHVHIHQMKKKQVTSLSSSSMSMAVARFPFRL